MNVMSIYWSPTSESDTAFTLDWILVVAQPTK